MKLHMLHLCGLYSCENRQMFRCFTYIFYKFYIKITCWLNWYYNENNWIQKTLSKNVFLHDSEILIFALNPLPWQNSVFSVYILYIWIVNLFSSQTKDYEVSYAPTLVKKLANQEAIIGAPAKFVCKALGEPIPKPKW